MAVLMHIGHDSSHAFWSWQFSCILVMVVLMHNVDWRAQAFCRRLTSTGCSFRLGSAAEPEQRLGKKVSQQG